MLKEEYFVNEKAGTVTCVLRSSKLAAAEYINNHFMQNNIKIYCRRTGRGARGGAAYRGGAACMARRQL